MTWPAEQVPDAAALPAPPLEGRLQRIEQDSHSTAAELRWLREQLRDSEVRRRKLWADNRQLKTRLDRLETSGLIRLSLLLDEASGFPRKLLRKLKKKLKRRKGKPRRLIAMGQPTAESRPRVAVILDEFSYRCFEPEFRLLPLSRDNWRAELEGAAVDFLLVELAWRGNGGRWSLTLSKFGKGHGDSLRELLGFCRDRGLPTVFWNKEDPVNFETFIDAARMFDHVFTVDADSIARYRQELGHDRVHAMAFAAQPQIHNPTGNRRDWQPKVCFAGAWRGNKYPGRADWLEILLGTAMRLGALEIYDRYADDKNEALRFPEPYRAAVLGSLPYDRMVDRYRQYAAFLNVNSVDGSPTMFSRRVFEILACATPVISSPSQGIQAMLGDVVTTAGTGAEAAAAIQTVIADSHARDRQGQRGYRLVHGHHTYAHRAEEMLDRIGRPAVLRAKPRVSMICVSKRPAFLEQALASMTSQTYPEVEILFVANSNEFDRSEVERLLDGRPRARCLGGAGGTLAEGLNLAIEAASGDFIAKFDDDDRYGPDYLGDLMLAAEFSRADIVGKRTYYVYAEGPDLMALRYPGHEFRPERFVHGATIVARRTVAQQVKFPPVRQGTDTMFLEACVQAGCSIFSADRFNFVHVRHADAHGHTWQVQTEDLLKTSEIVGPGMNLAHVFV